MTTAMVKMKINPTHAKIRVDKIWEESAATATLDFAHYKDHVRRYESRMLDLFDAFDTSNTGGLSRDELEAGIRGGAPPGTTDREVRKRGGLMRGCNSGVGPAEKMVRLHAFCFVCVFPL